MSKVITFRVNDEEEKQLSRAIILAREYNRQINPLQDELSVSDALKLMFRSFELPKQGVKIPARFVTKDEVALFLGISSFSKEWSTFMDKIEKVYVK